MAGCDTAERHQGALETMTKNGAFRESRFFSPALHNIGCRITHWRIENMDRDKRSHFGDILRPEKGGRGEKLVPGTEVRHFDVPDFF